MSNPEEGHQSEAGHPPQSQDQSQGGGAGGGTGEAGTMDRQQQQQQEQAQEINHHQQQDSRNPVQEEDEEQEGEHGSANGHQHANATTGPSDQEEPEQKRKLFLGGLDYGTREEALREYFSTFGTLKDVVVMRFPDTKRSRGFGFVTFATSQEANQCFQAKPHTIDGVVIETKRATPREEAGGPGGGRRGRRSEHDDDDEGLDGDQRPPGKEPECQRKLFIGGLDYGTSDEGLRDYFSQFGQIVDSVVMKFRDTKRSRGFGFVTYATAAMVDECQARRPHTLDGTKIEVKRATPREEVDRGDDGQTVNKVFVGGLSDAITDDVLREYFSQFGHVVSAEHRVVKSTGKKRGFGFVEFDDYDPVDKLLLKPRHMLKGRRLDVKRAVSKSEMHMRDEPRGERDDYRYHRDRPPAPWAGGRQPGYDSRGGYARGGADRDAFGPGPFGPREVSSPWDRPARAQPSPWQSAGGGSAGGAGGNSWEGQAGGWGQSAATPWMDDGYGPPREARGGAGGGGSSYGGGSAYGGGGGSAYGGGSSYGAGSSYGGGGYGGDSMAGGASRDAGGPMRNNFGSYYNRNAAPYDRNGRGGSRPAAPVEGGGYGYMSGGSAGGAGGGGARWVHPVLISGGERRPSHNDFQRDVKGLLGASTPSVMRRSCS